MSLFSCGCRRKGRDGSPDGTPVMSPRTRERSRSADVDSRLVGFCTDAELMEDYDTVKVLHTSSCTLVELCNKRSSGEQQVIKIFNKKLANKTATKTSINRLSRTKSKGPVEKMMSEVRILESLNHDNIVNQLEVVDDEQNEMLYIVMEYVGGGPSMQWNGTASRYDATPDDRKDCTGLDMRTVHSYFCDAAAGLDHIHSYKIIHRDLKPENMLTTVTYDPHDPQQEIGTIKVTASLH